MSTCDMNEGRGVRVAGVHSILGDLGAAKRGGRRQLPEESSTTQLVGGRRQLHKESPPLREGVLLSSVWMVIFQTSG